MKNLVSMMFLLLGLVSFWPANVNAATCDRDFLFGDTRVLLNSGGGVRSRDGHFDLKDGRKISIDCRQNVWIFLPVRKTHKRAETGKFVLATGTVLETKASRVANGKISVSGQLVLLPCLKGDYKASRIEVIK